MTLRKSVTIEAVPDEHPPLDHLGEYSDQPGEPERTIDRQKRNDRGRNELRYFIAARAEDADALYDRAEEISSGRVAHYGIRAVAEIEAAGAKQEIKSPACWGVPSDYPTAQASEIAREELSHLADILGDMGLGDDIDGANWDPDAPWHGAVTL